MGCGWRAGASVHLLHVVPVGDDAVLDRVFQREGAVFFCLVADVLVLLPGVHSRLARAANDRGEDGTRGVIAREASLAHAGAVVDHKRRDLIISHGCLERVSTRAQVEQSAVSVYWPQQACEGAAQPRASGGKGRAARRRARGERGAICCVRCARAAAPPSKPLALRAVNTRARLAPRAAPVASHLVFLIIGESGAC